MDLIVTARELRYGGKVYLKGETVSLDETAHNVGRDIRVLKVLKKVEDAPIGAPLGEIVSQVAPPERVPVDPVAAPSPAEPSAQSVPQVSAQPKASGGRYTRRDLRAEG